MPPPVSQFSSWPSSQSEVIPCLTKPGQAGSLKEANLESNILHPRQRAGERRQTPFSTPRPPAAPVPRSTAAPIQSWQRRSHLLFASGPLPPGHPRFRIPCNLHRLTLRCTTHAQRAAVRPVH
ncbi:hypothetical protein B0T21DRAFT_47742 [Apiosordaria backusii]|uniref:Uncharacterized protein n=1 Tax=Apiosordaria backusii TaxID=314023 RepID=A0AA40AXU9_9PEZI|nr:hypothetical protein B0T21DRAFT_47742 [Apiosordaria backusii]